MTKKIGVSLPDDLYARMQAEVELGRAASVSGLITEAVGSYLQRVGLADLVADLRREFGEPTAEEAAWAADVLDRAIAVMQGQTP